jgi:hypothetical protein
LYWHNHAISQKPNGIWDDPSKATAEKGKLLEEIVVKISLNWRKKWKFIMN